MAEADDLQPDNQALRAQRRLNMEDLNSTREQLATMALTHLRAARDLLQQAGSRRTLAKLRTIMDSAEGAVRAAHYRDMRLARHGEEVASYSSPERSREERTARLEGYRVVTFPDDPGKYYWKTAHAVAFTGEDTIEGAWRAACNDCEIEAEG